MSRYLAASAGWLDTTVSALYRASTVGAERPDSHRCHVRGDTEARLDDSSTDNPAISRRDASLRPTWATMDCDFFVSDMGEHTRQKSPQEKSWGPSLLPA